MNHSNEKYFKQGFFLIINSFSTRNILQSLYFRCWLFKCMKFCDIKMFLKVDGSIGSPQFNSCKHIFQKHAVAGFTTVISNFSTEICFNFVLWNTYTSAHLKFINSILNGLTDVCILSCIERLSWPGREFLFDFKNQTLLRWE